MTGHACNEPESKLSIGRRISLQLAVDEPYDWPTCLLTKNIYPRFAEPALVEALADTPVFLIYGPRQFGKTTLDLEGQLSKGAAAGFSGMNECLPAEAVNHLLYAMLLLSASDWPIRGV